MRFQKKQTQPALETTSVETLEPTTAEIEVSPTATPTPTKRSEVDELKAQVEALTQLVTALTTPQPPAEDKYVEIEFPAPAVQSDPRFVPPDYPKELYNDAHVENQMVDFNTQLGNAMRPPVREYVTPAIPEAIAERTRLEMEAGKAAVQRHSKIEGDRRVLAAATRRKDPWESGNVEVFRPAGYVPDPRRNEGHVQHRTIQSS